MRSRRRKGESKRAHRGRGRAYSNPNDDAAPLPVRGRSLGEARLLLVNCAPASDPLSRVCRLPVDFSGRGRRAGGPPIACDVDHPCR